MPNCAVHQKVVFVFWFCFLFDDFNVHVHVIYTCTHFILEMLSARTYLSVSILFLRCTPVSPLDWLQSSYTCVYPCMCWCLQFVLPAIVHIKNQPRLQRDEGPIVSVHSVALNVVGISLRAFVVMLQTLRCI